MFIIDTDDIYSTMLPCTMIDAYHSLNDSFAKNRLTFMRIKRGTEQVWVVVEDELKALRDIMRIKFG